MFTSNKKFMSETVVWMIISKLTIQIIFKES